MGKVTSKILAGFRRGGANPSALGGPRPRGGARPVGTGGGEPVKRGGAWGIDSLERARSLGESVASWGHATRRQGSTGSRQW